MAALAVYSVSGSGPLFMSATAKIGTAAPSGATRAWAPAAVACMGIVFGDIGTSPLYALSVAAKAAKSRRTTIAAGCARRRVVDLLVTNYRHLHQIRDPDHAGRQSRRGRHPGVARFDQPAPRQAEQAACDHGRDRPCRGDLALRRRHYHAGHFRPERDRGHQGLRPPNGACRRPSNSDDSRPLVHDPAQRHRLDRQHIRADHANLVRRGRGPWHYWNCQDTCRASRLESFAGHRLSVARWALGFRGDRRRFPRGDRRRGILRRHGPFRAVSNPRRLVRRGIAGADPQLFRPRRIAAHRAQRHRQPVLSARPAMVTLRSGRAGTAARIAPRRSSQGPIP